MKKVATGALGSAAKKGPAAAVEALQMLVKAHADYTRISETEQTQREQIRQRGLVELTRLRNQRETLQQYLDLAFAERKHIITQSFEQLDRAIARGDLDIADKCLSTIITVAKESPLAQVKSVMQAMSDKNVDVIDI